LRARLKAAGVVPVLTIDDASRAAKLATVLCEAGINVLEVTLRTPAALEALSNMAMAVPQAVVGVGTVLDADDLRAAQASGAQFAVSPGATASLLNGAADIGLPLIPGVATPSEMMAARENGLRLQKFFPAEAAGGRWMLSAVRDPLPDVMFWPTGGIDVDIATDYLALANVLAVGGSWIAPRSAIGLGDWSFIAARARDAVELASASVWSGYRRLARSLEQANASAVGLRRHPQRQRRQLSEKPPPRQPTAAAPNRPPWFSLASHDDRRATAILRTCIPAFVCDRQRGWMRHDIDRRSVRPIRCCKGGGGGSRCSRRCSVPSFARVVFA
jgi:2-dehydro-3-deoxyphosphogluconate aldolase/(4S)-4-hydroxy-2-oxoglutarate aldolase